MCAAMQHPALPRDCETCARLRASGAYAVVDPCARGCWRELWSDDMRALAAVCSLSHRGRRVVVDDRGTTRDIYRVDTAALSLLLRSDHHAVLHLRRTYSPGEIIELVHTVAAERSQARYWRLEELIDAASE